jgi:lactoylglutathione lyase
MEATIQLIGFGSAVLTTCAFVPQAIKTWKTKSTDDLSPLMFVLFCFGIAGWLIYGLLRTDLPMILANAVTICLAGIIMYFIIRPDNTRKIGHLGLYVKDLEKMKGFYVSYLNAKAGNKYINSSKGFHSYLLTFSSGAKLELMYEEKRKPDDNTKQWGHIAISVGSKKSVDSLHSSLKSDGLQIISGPRTTGDGCYEFVISDPENNFIEITE